MKKLTIEQKAAAYDEAIERVENIKTGKCETKFIFTEGLFEHIFPELKEEESEDERIRESLLEYLHTLPNHYAHGGVCAPEWIAWLEKQGESDETKAKMFLINKGYPIDANGKFPTYEEMYNIIKDGLEKQGEQKPIFEMKTPEESLGIDSDTYNKIVDECIYGEQKPAWSEEDERCLTNAIYACKQMSDEDYDCSQGYIDAINFLKSLKERYTWKPSDEQIASITWAVRKMKESACYDSELVSLFNDLKKLREE